MSQSTPPSQPGQIEAPNPLELFWEQHKTKAYVVLTIFAVLVAGNYAWRYMEKMERNAAWSEFAVASALDRGYVEPGSSYSVFEQFVANNAQAAVRFYIPQLSAELATDLVEDLQNAKAAELESIVAKGGSRAPLALWALAGRHVAKREWDEALARLATLEADYPEHFLVKQSSYPVQYRPEVESEEEEAEDEKPKPPSNDPPELEPAVAGSAVSMLRSSIEKEQAFEQDNPAFFTAPEPTSEQTVVFQIRNAGTIKIRLYPDRAPKHVARFLELAEAGYWKDQNVHEIQRATDSNPMGDPPSEMRFGWSSTTNEDRSTWEAGEVAEEDQVDWEANDLSHFPGMVAAIPDPTLKGKSQVERIAINAADVASLHDGARVIFGRVVEGLDVVETIVNAGFVDEQALNAGRGQPDELFTIESVTIE